MTKPLVYHTLEGLEVPYGPVSSKLVAVIDTKYPTDVNPPTYRFEDVTGDFIEAPHDEETIKDERTTDEEKEAWVAYEAEKARLVKVHNEEIIRLCFVQGIKLPLPEDDSWLEPHRYLGADIPEELHDLRLYWLFTEIVKTEYDIYELTRKILNAAGAYLGMRAVAASTFRGEMGERNGADSSESSEPATEEQQKVVA